MQSILKTIVDSDFLEYNKTLSSDEIESVISDFEVPYGNQETVLIKFEAAHSDEFTPQVSIDRYEANYTI